MHSAAGGDLNTEAFSVCRWFVFIARNSAVELKQTKHVENGEVCYLKKKKTGSGACFYSPIKQLEYFIWEHGSLFFLSSLYCAHLQTH